jgi:MFS family permease
MRIWNFLVSIAGAYLADRIGRRSLWLISLVGMLCANIGISITRAVFTRTALMQPHTWQFPFFSCAMPASILLAIHLAYSYPTGILPYNMRTNGLAVMVAIDQALLIVSQYANSVAIAAIGWKY